MLRPQTLPRKFRGWNLPVKWQSWARTLMVLARDRVCARKDQGPLLDELIKHLPGGDRGPIAEAAARLGSTEGALKTAISRFRDDFADAIRFEIGRTVSSPREIEEEIRATNPAQVVED